jgi:hypothetical protein
MKKFFIPVLCAAVLALCGCVYEEPSYHVYYHGNGNTLGFPPLDTRVYFTGDTVTVLAAPEDMKKGEYQFGGWQMKYSDDSYPAGAAILVRYDDIELYAIWEGDRTPFTYEIDTETDEVTITSYDGLTTEYVNVPGTIEDKPVTRIGYRAFQGLYLVTVNLPEGIKYIDEEAFANNSWLRMTIPGTVEVIGIAAFQGCDFKTLDLGSKTTSIGAYAFDANYYLYSVSIPGVTDVGVGAFRNSDIISIKIGANVEISSNSAFGTYGESFRAYYNGKNKPAGVYIYGGTKWNGPYTDTDE